MNNGELKIIKKKNKHSIHAKTEHQLSNQFFPRNGIMGMALVEKLQKKLKLKKLKNTNEIKKHMQVSPNHYSLRIEHAFMH